MQLSNHNNPTLKTHHFETLYYLDPASDRA